MKTKQSAFEFTKAILEASTPVSESTIQGEIIDYLILQQALGKLLVQRINNMPVYDQARGSYRALGKGVHKGFPDILVLKNGVLIGLEVKTERGKLSADQERMAVFFSQHGAEYHVVRSLNEAIKIIST